MALSTNDLVRLRRMCADMSDTPDFYDAELVNIAEQYPLDGGGYDLNAAAAAVWEMKAAMLTTAEESFSADGKQFQYGDLRKKALAMSAHFSRRANEAYSRYGTVTVMRDDVDEYGEGGRLL